MIHKKPERRVVEGKDGKSAGLTEVLQDFEVLATPLNVDANIFAQNKSALAEEWGRSIPSGRDPVEGRVNFSPAEGAWLKSSVLQGKDGGVHPEGDKTPP